MDLKLQFHFQMISRRTSSYVLISRGKNRFVDELQIPNAELRSSTVLLSELEKAEEGDLCLAKSKTGILETGADTLSVFPRQACLFTQWTIPTTERKWKVIPATSSHGALPTAVSKMVARLVRHYDQDERQPDAAIHWEAMKPVLLKAFEKQGARDFSDEEWLRLVHEGCSKTRFEFCKDFKNSLAYFRAIQGHSGGITIDPELMGHILTRYKWKEYHFHRVVLAAFNLSLRTDWFRVERKAREDGRLSSSHHSFLSVKIPTKKNPVMITQILKKCTITAIGNVIRMPSIG